jgi:hypothetical protein
MVQALGGQLAIVEARVRVHASQCGIYGGQNDTESGVLRVLRLLPVTITRTIRAPYSFTDVT